MNPTRSSRLPLEALASDPAWRGQYRRLDSLRGVRHELRYASADNFAGRVLYAGMDCAWLRHEAAAGLEAAADWLALRAPGHTLIVLDALRPQRVQQAIWREVEGTAMQMYFAPPEPGSVHSFGMAVDVTLLDAQGRELDMGSGFDEMHERSHPALHDALLARGALRPEHVQRRSLLADAMAAGGFAGIATEWWHFDHGDRARVRRELPRIE